MSKSVSQPEKNPDSYKVEIEIHEEHDIENIYIHLKSDPLQQFTNQEIEDIINNNGIAFQNNKQWVGTRKSYISIYGDECESMISLQEILTKYGNLITHICDNDKGHLLFAINRDLLKDYFTQISTYMDKNYEVENCQIYLTISNSFRKTEISNLPTSELDKYLYVNTNLEKKSNPDLILELPIELSQVIKKIENDQTLTLEEQQLKEQLQKTLLNYSQQEETSIRIHLRFSEDESTLYLLSDLVNLLQK
jgi:hypothetical protein